MKRGWHKLEVFIDKAIFPALLVLLAIILLELFFKDVLEHYHLYIEIADGIVILIFLIDLVFKYLSTKNIPNFLKKYWLEIIAVIPFFWIFRAFEGFARIFGLIEETTKEGQQILHVGVELARGEEGAAKVGRAGRLERFLRPISRVSRFLKLKPKEYEKEGKEYLKEGKKYAREGKEYLEFFEEPVEKEVKNIFKEAKIETRKVRKLLKNI